MIGSGQIEGDAMAGLEMFQSLLFWMIGSGNAIRFRFEAMSEVSILVVLDDWFGGYIHRYWPSVSRCFNPCCFG
jgi:hypothetical protein